MPTKTNKSPINFSVSGFLAPMIANKMASNSAGSQVMPSFGASSGLANVLANKKQSMSNNSKYSFKEGLMDFAIGTLGGAKSPTSQATVIDNNSPVMRKRSSIDESPLCLSAGVKGALAGANIGTMIPIPGVGTALGAGVGYLIGKRKEKKTEEEALANQPNTYSTNIDLYGEEIMPNQDLVNKTVTSNRTNIKPFKQLTQNEGNTARNMSAFQYKSGLKMSVISGSSNLPMRSSLMFTEEGLNKLPNDIEGKFGDIVRKEKTKQQNK